MIIFKQSDITADVEMNGIICSMDNRDFGGHRRHSQGTCLLCCKLDSESELEKDVCCRFTGLGSMAIHMQHFYPSLPLLLNNQGNRMYQ